MALQAPEVAPFTGRDSHPPAGQPTGYGMARCTLLPSLQQGVFYRPDSVLYVDNIRGDSCTRAPAYQPTDNHCMAAILQYVSILSATSLKKLNLAKIKKKLSRNLCVHSCVVIRAKVLPGSVQSRFEYHLKRPRKLVCLYCFVFLCPKQAKTMVLVSSFGNR